MKQSQQPPEFAYPGHHQGEDPINFREWFYRILAYWWLILSCVVLALASVWVFHRYSIPRYNVATTILVSQENKNPGEMLLEELSMFSGKVNIQNEIGILKSMSLLARTIDTLNFEVEYYTLGRIRVAEQYQKDSPYKVEVIENRDLSGATFMVDFLGNNQFKLYPNSEAPVRGLEEQILTFPALVEGPGYLLRVVKQTEEPLELSEGEHKFVVYDPMSLAKQYRNQLNITNANKESSILTISIESSLQEKALDFLNMLVDQYIQRELNQKNLTAERTIDFIDRQLMGIEDTLTIIEDRLQNFRSANRIVNMSEEGAAAVQKFQQLEQRRAQEEIKLEYFDYILEYLNKNRNPSSVISPATVGIESPVLDALVQNLNELSAQLTQLELNATEINPQVESLQVQIQRVMSGVIENVESLKESTNITLQDIAMRIREAEQSLNQLPKTERAFVNIQRRFNLSENLFIYLQEKKAEAGIAKASNVPENKRLDPAIVMAQTFPNAKRNYAFGLMLGFALPIGLILLSAFLSNKIESISDIEKGTDLPVLGTLAYSHYKTELVLRDHPRSLAAESFRKVKASMKYLENSSPAQVIMVTSFHSGEGKSFSAMNFACMLANMNKKVMLIGLDLRRPKMYAEFEVSNNYGVSSILIGEKSLDKVRHHTNIENLDLLVSGPIPPNPNELLTSNLVTDLFVRLKQEYDYVIMDTSPIGLVSDAMELGRHADLVLFIVRHQYTPKHALDYINDIHEKKLLPRMGIVLNGVDFKKFKNRLSHSYGYGYGYGYGYNGSNGYYEE